MRKLFWKSKLLLYLFFCLFLGCVTNTPLEKEIGIHPCNDPVRSIGKVGWIQEDGQDKFLFTYTYLSDTIYSNTPEKKARSFYQSQYYTVNRDGSDLKPRPEISELLYGKNYAIKQINQDYKSVLVGQVKEKTNEDEVEQLDLYVADLESFEATFLNTTLFSDGRNSLSSLQISPDQKYLIYAASYEEQSKNEAEIDSDQYRLVDVENKANTILNIQTLEETKKSSVTIGWKSAPRILTLNYSTQNQNICSLAEIDVENSALNEKYIISKTDKDSQLSECLFIGFPRENHLLYLFGKYSDPVISLYDYNLETQESKKINTMLKDGSYYEPVLFRLAYFTPDLQQVALEGGSRGVLISGIIELNQTKVLVPLKNLPAKGYNKVGCDNFFG